MTAPDKNDQASAIDPTVEEALIRGLFATEASRRVGWAKMFTAVRRIERLEEELRITHDEHEVQRRAYSRLLGLVDNLPWLPRSEILDTELDAHLTAEHTFRRQDAWDAGAQIAEEHADYLHSVLTEQQVFGEPDHLTFAEARGRLAARAREHGHDVAVTSPSLGVVTARCSCGEGTPDGSESEKAALGWAAQHEAWAAYGVDFRVWRLWAKRLPRWRARERQVEAVANAEEVIAKADRYSTIVYGSHNGKWHGARGEPTGKGRWLALCTQVWLTAVQPELPTDAPLCGNCARTGPHREAQTP